MKNVIRWIILVWTVLSIPYMFTQDMVENFFALVYICLIGGLVVSDLIAEDKRHG